MIGNSIPRSPTRYVMFSEREELLVRLPLPRPPHGATCTVISSSISLITGRATSSTHSMNHKWLPQPGTLLRVASYLIYEMRSATVELHTWTRGGRNNREGYEAT